MQENRETRALSRRRLACRIAFWTAAAAGVVCAALLVWGLARPSWYARGGFVAGVTSGRAEVAWSNAQLSRQSLAWGLQGPSMSASVMLAPGSSWLPTIRGATVGTGPVGVPQTLYTLSVLYVPLWPLVTVIAAIGGAAFWMGRRIPIPGHCRKCGYNLAGLKGGTCPECGHPVGVLARVLRAAEVCFASRAGAGRPATRLLAR